MSPILFGWFFVEASPTCFCIFVKCFFCNLFPGIFWGKRAFLGLHSLSMNFFHFKNILPATWFCCFLGVREIICWVVLGRNCSQGKLKLIYLMMLLQVAMIVKSLPKYMYMYCPALSFVYQLKCFGMQSPRTKECTAASSITDKRLPGLSSITHPIRTLY